MRIFFLVSAIAISAMFTTLMAEESSVLGTFQTKSMEIIEGVKDISKDVKSAGKESMDVISDQAITMKKNIRNKMATAIEKSHQAKEKIVKSSKEAAGKVDKFVEGVGDSIQSLTKKVKNQRLI